MGFGSAKTSAKDAKTRKKIAFFLFVTKAIKAMNRGTIPIKLTNSP